MYTKIFCDIAELDQIKKFNKKKIVKGFTTNPSLMRKAGAKDYKSYSKQILKNITENLEKVEPLLQTVDDAHEAILKNKPIHFLYHMNVGWQQKKKTSSTITENPKIKEKTGKSPTRHMPNQVDGDPRSSQQAAGCQLGR